MAACSLHVHFSSRFKLCSVENFIILIKLNYHYRVNESAQTMRRIWGKFIIIFRHAKLGGWEISNM